MSFGQKAIKVVNDKAAFVRELLQKAENNSLSLKLKTCRKQCTVGGPIAL